MPQFGQCARIFTSGFAVPQLPQKLPVFCCPQVGHLNRSFRLRRGSGCRLGGRCCRRCAVTAVRRRRIDGLGSGVLRLCRVSLGGAYACLLGHVHAHECHCGAVRIVRAVAAARVASFIELF